MEIGKNVLAKRLITASCAVFCCLLTPCKAVNWQSNSGQQIPESEILGLLDTFAAQTEANYEKISTWQGQLTIETKDYYYGNMVERLNIAKDDPATTSSRIVRTVSVVGKFAIDNVNDKLYYEESKPDVTYRALDLNTNVTVNEVYSPCRAILTPEGYMHYEPGLTYGSLGRPREDSIVGKAAFLLPPEDAEGDISDPRRYFGPAQHNRIWDVLKEFRDSISKYGNPLIVGHPHYKIEKIGTKQGPLYRITGTFFASPDDESKLLVLRLVLDGSVGYNLVHHEVIGEYGKITQILDLTYEKIGDVFIPNSRHRKLLNSNQEPTLDSKITIENSILNETIPAETFTYKNLGLENGARFIDNIKGIEYIYKNGELILSYQLQ